MADVLGLQAEEGGEVMPERRITEGAESRHNVNRVPMPADDWRKVRAWCAVHEITMGELVAMLLRDWMKRRKI